ncbi:hypothetical protein A4G99_10745 [Haladaptatus sp. R4]|uniref:hypothetical protein n=1 Tax=Haladaptatus sp. R4 TaxID=1679489 RepID=UPI0007B4E743|nr:hypothetical protein [Haladaptatus sp. R4]KZN24799.1 hypothetical protein A4G99_10745 [Haladaptatus sp. R4]
MSRNIRITIDDDEVFERLKHRKRELDLSWEEALRRGLERGPHDDERRGARRGGGHKRGRTHARQMHDQRHHRHRGRERHGKGHPSPFDPDFGEQLRRGIEESVQESMHSVEESVNAVREGLGTEIDRLEDAEDAVLAFPFLSDERAQVPLRVNLRTSADGLSVEVVAVRRGKNTAETNRFADDHRAEINRWLADGRTVRLELQNGTEAYDVVPSLSWGRADDDTPIVTEVEIVEVRFD